MKSIVIMILLLLVYNACIKEEPTTPKLETFTMSGTINDSENNQSYIPNVKILCNDSSVYSDMEGYFEFDGIKGMLIYLLIANVITDLIRIFLLRII